MRLILPVLIFAVYEGQWKLKAVQKNTTKMHLWGESALCWKAKKACSVYLNMKKAGKCLDHSMSAQNYHLQRDSYLLEKGLRRVRGWKSKLETFKLTRKHDYSDQPWESLHSLFLDILDHYSGYLLKVIFLPDLPESNTNCRDECKHIRMKSKFFDIQEAKENGINQISVQYLQVIGFCIRTSGNLHWGSLSVLEKSCDPEQLEGVLSSFQSQLRGKVRLIFLFCSWPRK